MFNLLKDIDSYQFWEGAKQNKLFIQKSTKSKKIFFIFKIIFRSRADEPFKWVESKGKRNNLFFYYFTYSWGSEFYINKTPYIIGIILLEEGVRLMSNIVDCDYKRRNRKKSKGSI